MGAPKKDWVVFADADSRDYGVYITEVKNQKIPSRDVEKIAIPGRNGSLTIDNGRWNDTEAVYGCAIPGDFLNKFSDFMAAILSQSGYCRLVDSISQDTYRLAMITQDVDAELHKRGKTGAFELTFTCKPQRYLLSGETPIQMGSGTVVNPTAFPAKPLITVYGTGPGDLSIGGVTVEIKALEDQITLDCETMNAWRKVGDAATQNKNGDIYAMEFPVLKPGDNPVQITGGISQIEIIPRWWTL